MNLIFICNARFSKGHDGYIYGYHTSINYQTLQHYLQVFDHVFVVARLDPTPGEFSSDIRLDAEGVTLLPVPHFIGPYQYLKVSREIKRTIKSYLEIDAAVICRIPGTLGRLAIEILTRKRRNFGVEVAADPFDVFDPKSFKHPLAIFLRYQSYFTLKRNLQAASCALYVTESALQKRYPVKPGVFQTHASNVVIDNEAYYDGPKKLMDKSVYTLICVGSLEQLYKSPDIVIQAIALLKQRGFSIQLNWLGDGKFRKKMEQLVGELKLSDQIFFRGIIKPSAKVREYLSSSDLFLIPSRTEGLPRSLIEAMAVGLPAVGTRIGGIPELLPDYAMVDVNDHQALADKIQMLLEDKDRINVLAAENHTRARDYILDSLNARRFSFYNEVIRLTKVRDDE